MEIKQYEPVKVQSNKSQKVIYNKQAIAIIIILGAMTFTLALILSTLFQFNLTQNIVMSWILTILFTISAFIIADKKHITEKQNTYMQKMVIKNTEYVPEIKEVEKPVIKYIDNPTIQIVEKPVEKNVYVEKPQKVIKEKIYIEKPRKKLNISKYEFVGSSETKTYHKRNCRFSKLIKKKYKISSDYKKDFKGFKKCKVCLKNN